MGERYTAREIDAVREQADLVALIGRQVKLVRDGDEFKGLCPFHGERTPSFTVVPEKGFYHCFGCGAHGSAIDWLMEANGRTFLEAMEELTGARAPSDAEIQASQARLKERDRAQLARRNRMQQLARRIWRDGKEALPDGPVGRYLKGRSLTPRPIPLTLRYCPGLQVYRDGKPTPQRLSAMAAAITAASEPHPKALTGLHVTFLALGPNGYAKASQDRRTSDGLVHGLVPSNKVIFGGKRGGAVRFDPPAAELHLGEGLETMLAVREAMQRPGRAFWAAATAENLARIRPPRELVQCVTIWEDDDASGTGAREAKKAAEALAMEGFEVRVRHVPRGSEAERSS